MIFSSFTLSAIGLVFDWFFRDLAASRANFSSSASFKSLCSRSLSIDGIMRTKIPALPNMRLALQKKNFNYTVRLILQLWNICKMQYGI